MSNVTLAKATKARLMELVLEAQGKEVQGSEAAKRGRRRVAMIIGGVASGLVFLSVYHLTCGVATLTGSPMLLAALMAVGIDIGLVASELAEMLAHGNVEVRRWSRMYMAMATVLSQGLNAYEFAAHAPETTLSQGLAISFGLVLPVMILVLARVAGKLWDS